MKMGFQKKFVKQGQVIGVRASYRCSVSFLDTVFRIMRGMYIIKSKSPSPSPAFITTNPPAFIVTK